MSTSIDVNAAPDSLRIATQTAGRVPAPSNPGPAVSGSPLVADRASGSNEPVAAQELQNAVDRIRELARTMKRDLEFSVDESTGRTVVKVIAAASGEVVRQIPPEEVLAIADTLGDIRSTLFRGVA